MKTASQTIFSILCILCIMATANAQFNVNTNSFWEAEVSMEDGSLKTGFVQVPNIGAVRKIPFKSTRKSAAEEIKRSEIVSIKVTSEKGKTFYFDNMPVGSIKKDKVSKKKYLMLMQASNNFVTFYTMGTYRTNNRTGEVMLVGKYIQGQDFPTFSYYMSKGDKTNAKMYYMTKQLGGIKKNAELYFAEDPALVEKIKNKDLKGKDVNTIITTFLETTKNM